MARRLVPIPTSSECLVRSSRHMSTGFLADSLGSMQVGFLLIVCVAADRIRNICRISEGK